MKEYYMDLLLLGIKPFHMLHYLGVNGKLSGNLAAIDEIKGAVPVVYGPRGCGFHYRYAARSRNTPYYELECADFRDKDVIFGAEKKLVTLLKRLDEEKHPEMIFVLPTVVSDIVQEDVAGILRQIQPEIKAVLIPVISQAFSHMNKNNTRKKLKEKARQQGSQKSNESVLYAGCGYVEVMDALAETVMEPQERIANAVNVETFIWGYGGAGQLQRVEALLRQMGIRIHTYLPAADLAGLRKAPAAALNIVRRKKWAITMKERFGTEFFHVADMAEWQGIQGLQEFYRTIGTKLGMEAQVEAVLATEVERIQERYGELKAEFAPHSFALVTRVFTGLPEKIALYQKEYGLRITSIVVVRNRNFQEEHGLDDQTMEQLHQRILARMEEVGCKAPLLVNPDDTALQKALQSCDYAICDTELAVRDIPIPILPSFISHPVFDFDSFLENMEDIARKMKKPAGGGSLLLKACEYDADMYPVPLDDRHTRAARDMYVTMWRMRDL